MDHPHAARIPVIQNLALVPAQLPVYLDIKSPQEILGEKVMPQYNQQHRTYATIFVVRSNTNKQHQKFDNFHFWHLTFDTFDTFLILFLFVFHHQWWNKLMYSYSSTPLMIIATYTNFTGIICRILVKLYDTALQNSLTINACWNCIFYIILHPGI